MLIWIWANFFQKNHFNMASYDLNKYFLSMFKHVFFNCKTTFYFSKIVIADISSLWLNTIWYQPYMCPSIFHQALRVSNNFDLNKIQRSFNRVSLTRLLVQIFRGETNLNSVTFGGRLLFSTRALIIGRVFFLPHYPSHCQTGAGKHSQGALRWSANRPPGGEGGSECPACDTSPSYRVGMARGRITVRPP